MRTEQGPKWFDVRLKKEVGKHLFCRRLLDSERWGIFHDLFGTRPGGLLVLVYEENGQDAPLGDGTLNKLKECDRTRFLGNLEPRMERLTRLEQKMSKPGLSTADRALMEAEHEEMVKESEVMLKDWLLELARARDEDEAQREKKRKDVIGEMAEVWRRGVKGKIQIAVPGRMGILNN